MFARLLILLCFVLVSCGDNNRELVPQIHPSHLTLLEIRDRQVLLEWDPIDPNSVRGNFKGYLIRTWNNLGSQVYAFPPHITKASVEFFPFSKNFITVSVRNEKFVGPPSEAISFDAPQLEPNNNFNVKINPLSEKSVLIQWTKPIQPNGVLLGYKIYCNDGKTRESIYQVRDPEKLQAKITGLMEGVNYQIGVSAINCAGESAVVTKEITMKQHIPGLPSRPNFIYKLNYTLMKKDDVCYKPIPTLSVFLEEDSQKEIDYYDYLISDRKSTIETTPTPIVKEHKACLVDCMVLWQPNLGEVPGESFYVKYKIKGDEEYNVTAPEMIEDFLILKDFNSCRNYELVLVAVDGDFSTESGILFTPTVLK